MSRSWMGDWGERLDSCLCCFMPSETASVPTEWETGFGLLSWSGCYGEFINLLLLPGISSLHSSTSVGPKYLLPCSQEAVAFKVTGQFQWNSLKVIRLKRLGMTLTSDLIFKFLMVSMKPGCWKLVAGYKPEPNKSISHPVLDSCLQ
jgi:hypothetical protein